MKSTEIAKEMHRMLLEASGTDNHMYMEKLSRSVAILITFNMDKQREEFPTFEKSMWAMHKVVGELTGICLEQFLEGVRANGNYELLEKEFTKAHKRAREAQK